MLELISKQPIVVAVLGSGGREHALALKCAESAMCKKVYVLPGNAGIAYGVAQGSPLFGKMEAHPCADLTAEGLTPILKKFEVDLVVIGPDDLLAQGLSDGLRNAGFQVFGPSKKAAQIESSKAFAKSWMKKVGIPTAKHETLTSKDLQALSLIEETLGGYPLAFKYDGLALGKGVRICFSTSEAVQFLTEVFEEKKFCRSKIKSEECVIVEQYLEGHEVSLFALCDGEDYVLLEPACDYKKLWDGNRGPNTGGMGAFSPVPWLSKEEIEKMANKVFPQLLTELKKAGISYSGLLYAGLMVSADRFWVLEFNARFGDPETQALMPRIESDLLPLLYGVAAGRLLDYLDAFPLRFKEDFCVTVIAASQGYPDAPIVGREISDHSELAWKQSPHEKIFFAGVKSVDGKLITSGGRALAVSSLGSTLEDARNKAYLRMGKIDFEGMQMRRDIGQILSEF